MSEQNRNANQLDGTESRRRLALWKVALLSVLYFVQGLPFGFFLFTFPLYLRDRQFSLAKITFISVVNLPWLIKFLWAPLADRYFWPGFGRRKSWIVPAQGALAVSLAVTGLLSPHLSLIGLMGFLTVVNFCAATQDIGVDGLAVDILEDHERGVGNSVQAAAYKVGMLGGGFGLTWLMPAVGIAGCFYTMGGLVVVSMAAPLLLKEKTPPAGVPLGGESSGGTAKGRKDGRNPGEVRAMVDAAGEVFRRVGAPAFVAFILLIKVGDAVANPLFRLFLRDGHLSLSQINWSMNLCGIAATLLGSAVCGFVIKWLGRRPALFLTVIGQGVSHLAWAILALCAASGGGPFVRMAGAVTAVYGVAVFEHLVSGMLTVVVFTLMMDAVRPQAGSAQYTLLMCLHLGSAFGVGMLSGALAQVGGYPFAFALAGFVTLGCLALVGPLQRHGYLAGRQPGGGADANA